MNKKENYKELLDKIVKDLKRMKSNTKTYLTGFMRFALLRTAPHPGSVIEFDIDSGKFKFHTIRKMNPYTLKEYVETVDRDSTIRDVSFSFYPKGKEKILLTPWEADPLAYKNKQLLYSNYSEPKKQRIVDEAGEAFYKWYQLMIQKELDYYTGLQEDLKPKPKKLM